MLHKRKGRLWRGVFFALPWALLGWSLIDWLLFGGAVSRSLWQLLRAFVGLA